MAATRKALNKKVKGFTLTEILLVLAIIGILILLALPNQGTIIAKAKAKEAQLQLNSLFTMQKSYFYERSRYSNSLDEIGFEQQKLTTEGGNANYRIEIVDFSNTGYVARATSVVDFDADGTYNVWEIDQEKNLKEVTKD